jgi:hypothetical protein
MAVIKFKDTDQFNKINKRIVKSLLNVLHVDLLRNALAMSILNNT